MLVVVGDGNSYASLRVICCSAVSSFLSCLRCGVPLRRVFATFCWLSFSGAGCVVVVMVNCFSVFFNLLFYVYNATRIFLLKCSPFVNSK